MPGGRAPCPATFGVVLSIGKVGSGKGDPSYYLDTVATGREDYYTGTGEGPGRWAGRGAAARGLSGRVEDDDFLHVLDPDGAAGNRSVLAYDLTFSAPKSVSVLYGVGDDKVSRAVRDAHDAAVLDALGYLEREACWTRRGRNGVRVLRGEGLMAALFRHRSSRAGDPQLHTHAVIANQTAAERRATALDGRALFAHAKTASYLYQASLRRELTERLGLRWTPVDQGIAEVVGIDAGVREHFSRRRAEIVEQMRECGGRSAHSAQIATLETDGPRTTTSRSRGCVTNGGRGPRSSDSTSKRLPMSSTDQQIAIGSMPPACRSTSPRRPA
jgi:conjugative relaxase-like TrwC/TraI family protein